MYILDKTGTARCTLDSSTLEAFTQKDFNELIHDAHARGQDYYIARVHCSTGDGTKGRHPRAAYVCYDARQLCKSIFEMVISAEGRRIRIKSFIDPVTRSEISEVNFFRLRHDSETPLRAEFLGNQIAFLESNAFRNRLFYQEDAMEALSVNFQFKYAEKLPYIKKKPFLDIFLVVVMLLLLAAVTFVGVRFGKHQLIRKDIGLESLNKL